MKLMNLAAAVILTAVCSCTGSSSPKARQLAADYTNKIMPLTRFLDNPDSCRLAISYLDSAVKIDRNCFLCHYNKLMFLCPLGQFDKAAETVNECIRIKPSAHDLYLQGGILYEKTGDTVSAAQYFRKSLAIVNPVLDTMNLQHLNREMLETNKAIALIMLGNADAGKGLLQSLADRQKNPEQRSLILPLMNKSKKELVEMMTGGKYDR